MNIAHCKSRGWLQYDIEQQEAIWGACGYKTLEILAHWHPRAIVAFGWTPLEWLRYAHNSNAQAYRDWHLDENGLRMAALVAQPHCLPVGQVATLTRSVEGRTDSLHFVCSQRYGPRKQWTPQKVKAVVNALRDIVGQNAE
jgi:hypothetical protein